MPAKPRRFQFRLRTLMIAVTLLAAVCGYVGWQAKIVREQKAMLERKISPGNYEIDRADERGMIPWVRWLLRD